jgi:hypothetical protein
MVAYLSSVTACIISLWLIHVTNAVQASKLHDFLRGMSGMLAVPHTSLLASVIATAFTNCVATLLTYDSWPLFYTRLGLNIAWLLALLAALRWMKLSANEHCGPPTPVHSAPLPAAPPALLPADAAAPGGGG